MKHKCYKLVKDSVTTSGKRLQDQVMQRLSISPHNHPAMLPGNSPAPSPASAASTGSVVSGSNKSNYVKNCFMSMYTT